MRKFALAMVLLALTLSMACAGNQYLVQTTTGQTYMAQEAPLYNGKTKQFKFKNEKGKSVYMPYFSVEEIKKAD